MYLFTKYHWIIKQPGCDCYLRLYSPLVVYSFLWRICQLTISRPSLIFRGKSILFLFCAPFWNDTNKNIIISVMWGRYATIIIALVLKKQTSIYITRYVCVRNKSVCLFKSFGMSAISTQLAELGKVERCASKQRHQNIRSASVNTPI